METNSGAISPYQSYCDGFGSPGAVGSGYFLGFVAGVGITNQRYSINGSTGLDDIIAFDNAEIEGAYLGQINMSTVSSFSGPQGLIWGYDVAKVNLEPSSLLESDILLKNKGIEIYDCTPLLHATEKLFGSNTARKFPLLPGAHVPCATKKFAIHGPSKIFLVFAIGIAEDRTKDACLLMEDCGEVKLDQASFEKEAVRNAVHSVLEIGNRHNIEYKKLLYYFVEKEIQEDEVGCALIALPYFSLAKKAVPRGGIKSLKKLTIQEWIKKTQR